MPEELRESREMKVEHVHIPLYSADYAWKVAYQVLPKNRIKLGVLLAEEQVGLRVRSVVKNSNAERAGILAGDLLLQADGKKIIDVEGMVGFLQTRNFGDEVSFRLRRNTAEQVVKVTLKPPK
jgi:S1-C subfamily serine protease